jgi:hypothetical protein
LVPASGTPPGHDAGRRRGIQDRASDIPDERDDIVRRFLCRDVPHAAKDRDACIGKPARVNERLSAGNRAIELTEDEVESVPQMGRPCRIAKREVERPDH